MQLISEMGYDPTFAQQAQQAGYIFRDGGYFTPSQIATYESMPRNLRTDTISGGLSQSQVQAQMQQNQMRQANAQQQQYAIDRQNTIGGDFAQQQATALSQRNAAADSALANAQAAPGPGRSLYDQRLQQMMLGSFTPDDPSYQWRLNQGTENLSRSLAAKGMLGSGNMAAELLSFGQGMASQEYGAQFNRLLQASAAATNQYATAYSVLERMLTQQQAQQGFGLDAERAAQGWGQLAQGWGQQNLGGLAQDVNSYQAGTQAGALALQRNRFNAEEQRLDQWASGENQALQQRLSGLQSSPQYVAPAAPTYGYSTPGSYYGPAQNNVASQLPSGTGYISNSSGRTTTFGNQSPSYQPWGNDYGYEAVYGD